VRWFGQHLADYLVDSPAHSIALTAAGFLKRWISDQLLVRLDGG
jgi:hypothetical protein